MKALSSVGVIVGSGLLMLGIWYGVAPPKGTMVITCSTGEPDERGFQRIRMTARPGDCRLGTIWRDAEGQHECIEAGRDYFCPQGCDDNDGGEP